MDIDERWIPTLLCIVNDSIKYNDSLRNSQTVRDVADIEDWLMSIYQFKGYLSEEIARNPDLNEKCKKYIDEC